MNKKILIILIVIVVVFSASGLFFGRFLKSGQNKLSETTVILTPAPVELASWEDPSQFTFNYPKNLNLNSHPEDNENYAHIELTSSVFPGSIVLWTKDTKYNSIDDYITGNKIINQIASTLGSFPAFKILDAADSNKYTLVTIKDGYLYQIDVDTKGENPPAGGWTEIFNAVADSYKFTESSTQQAVPQNADEAPVTSDDISVEEEVIE